MTDRHEGQPVALVEECLLERAVHDHIGLADATGGRSFAPQTIATVSENIKKIM